MTPKNNRNLFLHESLTTTENQPNMRLPAVFWAIRTGKQSEVVCANEQCLASRAHFTFVVKGGKAVSRFGVFCSRTCQQQYSLP